MNKPSISGKNLDYLYDSNDTSNIFNISYNKIYLK